MRSLTYSHGVSTYRFSGKMMRYVGDVLTGHVVSNDNIRGEIRKSRLQYIKQSDARYNEEKEELN